MNIDLSSYPEVCHECGSPARTEIGNQTSDDLHGTDVYQFCVNPKCIQYDANITRKRERAEEAVRQSASYRRNHKKLMAYARAVHGRRARKQRQAILASYKKH